MKANLKQCSTYSSFKKSHGPPYEHFNNSYDPLDKNEYLLRRGVDVE
jgi:hypothetical protein